MNPVFYLMVIVAAILIWTLLAFIFYPLGKLVYRIFKETVRELNRNDDKEKEEEKE